MPEALRLTSRFGQALPLHVTVTVEPLATLLMTRRLSIVRLEESERVENASFAADAVAVPGGRTPW